MKNKNIHTVYNSDRKMWENKHEGNSKPISSHHTKDNAVNSAEKTARQEHVELIVHKKDGQFDWRNSYGNDPFPPKG